MDCFNCDNCPFVGSHIPDNLYEIHITIKRPNNIEEFKNLCDIISVKPIILDLDNVMVDVMTTSRVFDFQNALDEVKRVRRHLTSSGYEVLRHKVETTLTNKLDMHCYFESHLAIKMGPDRKEQLKSIITNAHISNNMFKDDIQMVTIRTKENNLDLHIKNVIELTRILIDNEFEISKTINERCIMDSNESHDEKWIIGRDEQIKFMKESDKRHTERLEKWMMDPKISKFLRGE